MGGCGRAPAGDVSQLNAINAGVVGRLHELYARWDAHPHVHAILIKGAGGKAFCAGGDVKAAVAGARAGRPADSLAFFRAEYRLNSLIGRLSKPHVAVIDGICMGGGCGLAMHGPFRVATERTLVAMPETALGLFCDVGGSSFLNRLCPGSFGTYLALSGARLRGPEVKAAGLATHFVPRWVLLRSFFALDPETSCR